MLSQQDHRSIKCEERAWQDRLGGTLQQRAYDRAGTRVVIHGQFACVVRALELRPGMRLLDLGCGVGHFLSWLMERLPVTCHGVDLSLNSVRCAREANPGPELTVGDAEVLPYRDSAFDRVTCNGAAHHFLDEQAAFREMFRVLAPGGRLVLYEPTTTAVTSALRRWLLRSDAYESPADLAHKEEFTAARAQGALRAAGFMGISTSLHDFLAYPLSGYYVGSPLARSRTIMGLLCRLERGLGPWSLLKPVLEQISWRLLVVATRPAATPALATAGTGAR